jgi:predicted flap endonuclease-1-like 5' DNA nuclease
MGKKVLQDDLTIIEGIGPKIEGLFHNFEIKSWKALSEVTVDKCQEVLDSGGDRYRIHDPASWPMQARMAYEGKWRELSRWQQEHDHGKI